MSTNLIVNELSPMVLMVITALLETYPGADAMTLTETGRTAVVSTKKLISPIVGSAVVVVSWVPPV